MSACRTWCSSCIFDYSDFRLHARNPKQHQTTKLQLLGELCILQSTLKPTNTNSFHRTFQVSKCFRTDRGHMLLLLPTIGAISARRLSIGKPMALRIDVSLGCPRATGATNKHRQVYELHNSPPTRPGVGRPASSKPCCMTLLAPGPDEFGRNEMSSGGPELLDDVPRMTRWQKGWHLAFFHQPRSKKYTEPCVQWVCVLYNLVTCNRANGEQPRLPD